MRHEPRACRSLGLLLAWLLQWFVARRDPSERSLSWREKAALRDSKVRADRLNTDGPSPLSSPEAGSGGRRRGAPSFQTNLSSLFFLMADEFGRVVHRERREQSAEPRGSGKASGQEEPTGSHARCESFFLRLGTMATASSPASLPDRARCVQGSDSELEGSDMDGIQSYGEMGFGSRGARRGKE